MNWRTVFYHKENGDIPVVQYLDSLPDKQAAKVIRSMHLLEEFGPSIGAPHVENIRENIRCLRVIQGSNIFRIFFFTFVDQQLVLLSGFTKKTPKTPLDEIRLALRYRDDFMNQKERDSHE